MSTKNSTTETDPILVSVIGSRLDAISKEVGQTMLRTSRSPIFSEARDFVTGIFDHHLRLLAQTAYIPVLMGTLPSALRSIAETFADDVDDGDVFILNDPFRGNNHPPDITVAKPVFSGGEIRFWAVSKGHHADVGGGGVVGYNPAARSVWEECIRIPPAKLLVAGKRNKALWDMILLNVRMPWLVEADLECQIGACTVGERSLRALIEKYGLPVLYDAADRILDASDRQMRSVLRKIPNGTYRAERFIDHDGINKDRMIGLRLELTVKDESVHFDWSASDPQAAGYVNSTLTNTMSASFQALFMTVCSEVRYNEGALRALSVHAPAGTIVNALEPAPVTTCTVVAAEAIVEATWLALAQAVPERVYAGLGALARAFVDGRQPDDRPTLRRHPLHGEVRGRGRPGLRRLGPHGHGDHRGWPARTGSRASRTGQSVQRPAVRVLARQRGGGAVAGWHGDGVSLARRGRRHLGGELRRRRQRGDAALRTPGRARRADLEGRSASRRGRASHRHRELLLPPARGRGRDPRDRRRGLR